MWFFGLRLISNEEYQAGLKARNLQARLAETIMWFHGWKDLRIIWEYVNGNAVQIGQVRRDYARLRGTDEYGD